MRRREFLTVAAAGLIAAPHISRAQAKWPERPVKLIVPFAPGGSTDLVARPWAEKLTQAFGQQFVVENRGGASGMIGAEAVAKSPADGYTYLLGTATAIVTLPLLRKVGYDPKAFVPIGRVGDAVTGFVVHPSTGLKTFADMVEYAKKNPGKLAFGSSGTATAPHLRLEMMKLKTGIDILHVPYRGGADVLNDLLPGVVHMQNEPITLPHVKAGKLILLNINGPVRNPDFPDVPTLTDLGLKDADVPIWFAFFGPAGLPQEIVSKMNTKMLEIARTDDMKKKMWAVNAIVPLQTPEEIARHLLEDIRLNAEMAKTANIKIE